MIRESILAICLTLAFAASATDPVAPPAPPPAAAKVVEASPPAAATPGAASAVRALPPMDFLSSVANDELYAVFKKVPAFSTLDEDLVGSPLTLMVTHTSRPTAGGQAAGLLSAILSGSTLGIIPLVSNEDLVVRYEVMLNGKVLTSHSFEKNSTRAINLWGGVGAYDGLGKAAFEWVQSTAAEAAAKLAVDPALIAVREEIDYYFPEQVPARDTAAKP